MCVTFGEVVPQGYHDAIHDELKLMIPFLASLDTPAGAGAGEGGRSPAPEKWVRQDGERENS